MLTSSERNFYGPMCKNVFCAGGKLMDDIYVDFKINFELNGKN